MHGIKKYEVDEEAEEKRRRKLERTARKKQRLEESVDAIIREELQKREAEKKQNEKEKPFDTIAGP